MSKKQIVKEYWAFDGSIEKVIQSFLDNNKGYKLASYQLCYCDKVVGVYALVIYELKEKENE